MKIIVNCLVALVFGDRVLGLINYIELYFFLDEIRRTLGEGTFGKVVEVRDLRG